MELSYTDKIWNRSLNDEIPKAAPGDRALCSMLWAHGLVMNGGVLHAVELLSNNELADAIAGYKFFFIDAIEDLFMRAKSLFDTEVDIGEYEGELDLEYVSIIPNDSWLVARFENYYNTKPQDFEPIIK
jgi:hypothetical protein